MSVTFAYPYAAPTVTLTLRNPDLGDGQQQDMQLNYGRAMDAGVYTYKRTPALTKLLLTFNFLTKATVDELIDFLHQSSGREIRYTDYNGVIWRGAISTDPNEIATTGSIPGVGSSSDECVEISSLTLEFEGEVV